MFVLNGFWLYKSQVMKNPTIFLVFLLSSASRRLHCALRRLYCGSRRLYCASRRLYCASRRLYCGVRRFSCGVRRFSCGVRRFSCAVRRFFCGVRRLYCVLAWKLFTKNNCFFNEKYSCQMWKFVIRKNSSPGDKKNEKWKNT